MAKGDRLHPDGAAWGSSGPVRAGRPVATGRVVKGGRTVGLVECDVLDDKERLVARASSTCMTLRSAQATGR